MWITFNKEYKYKDKYALSIFISHNSYIIFLTIIKIQYIKPINYLHSCINKKVKISRLIKTMGKLKNKDFYQDNINIHR